MHAKTQMLWAAAAVVLFLSPLASADVPEKLEFRWKYGFPAGLAGVKTADVDNDGVLDIIAIDRNNTLFILDTYGGRKLNYSIGDPEEDGIVYDFEVVDYDQDMELELLVAFGGRRVLVQHPWDEYFNRENKSFERRDRFLYRSLSFQGSLWVMDVNGSLEWRYDTNMSVNDVHVSDIDGDGRNEILLGLGSYSREEYWVKGPDYSDGKENWTLVEYPSSPGEMQVLDLDGERIRSFYIPSTETGSRVRSVYAADLRRARAQDVLCGSDNGLVYVLNQSNAINWTFNASQPTHFILVDDLEGGEDREVVIGAGDQVYSLAYNGKLLWRYRFTKEAEAAQITDMDYDGEKELFLVSRDSRIYVFYPNGAVMWHQMLGEPQYHLEVADLSGDGYAEVIVGSAGNVTVYELDEDYIRERRLDGYYRRAQREYNTGDMTLARIYLEKSRAICLEIGDPACLPRLDELLEAIKTELRMNRKLKADFYYAQAFDRYGVNDYEEARTFVHMARDIYVEVNDAIGIRKCDTLLSQIEREIRLTRELQADGVYTDALRLYGFHNYSGAKAKAEEARKLYQEIDYLPGVEKSNGLILQVGNAYFELAKTALIGLDYNASMHYNSLAVGVYEELGNEENLNITRQLAEDIRRDMQRREEAEPGLLARSLPLLLAVLVAVLLFSLYRKRKLEAAAEEEAFDEETIDLERRLERII